MTSERDLAKEAIRAIILQSAPERVHQLTEFWERYEPQFALANDKPGFKLETVFNTVVYGPRLPYYLWIAAHASWRALYAYSPAFLFCRDDESCTLDVLSNFSDQSAFEKSYSDHIDALRVLSDTEHDQVYQWPRVIPTPMDSRPTPAVNNYCELATVFDLHGLATAAVFLHEIRHIQFRESESNHGAIEEEMECDRFASGMLLDAVDEFARAESQSEVAVRAKRAMGIVVSLLMMSKFGEWEETSSHPALSARFREFVMAIPHEIPSYFWVFTASAILATLKYHRSVLPNVEFCGPKDLTIRLLDHLD